MTPRIVLKLALQLALCFVLIAGDNPTAIVEPYQGPDPGYIVAGSGNNCSSINVNNNVILFNKRCV